LLPSLGVLGRYQSRSQWLTQPTPVVDVEYNATNCQKRVVNYLTSCSGCSPGLDIPVGQGINSHVRAEVLQINDTPQAYGSLEHTCHHISLALLLDTSE